MGGQGTGRWVDRDRVGGWTGIRYVDRAQVDRQMEFKKTDLLHFID